VWDVETGEMVAGPFRHNGPVSSVVFSPDGRHIVSGSGDKIIRIWDAGSSDSFVSSFTTFRDTMLLLTSIILTRT
jgi:WD40 repeat protein